MNLAEIIENTRCKAKKAVMQAIDEANLPAYLAEGIALDILAELRSRKSAEMMTLSMSEMAKLEEENKKMKEELKQKKEIRNEHQRKPKRTRQG